MLLSVPSARGMRLVALSDHALYELDGPLGPLRVLAEFRERQSRAAAGPGFVGVFDGKRLRFVDVDTGTAVAGFVGTPLLLDLAFHSMTDGVVRLAPGNVAATTDGGKTFRPAPAGAEEAFKARDAPIVPRSASHLLHWLAVARADPRAIAARRGVLVREGEALVAASGLLARVDLATGAVRELAS
jgi:hypothetical protein